MKFEEKTDGLSLRVASCLARQTDMNQWPNKYMLWVRTYSQNSGVGDRMFSVLYLNSICSLDPTSAKNLKQSCSYFLGNFTVNLESRLDWFRISAPWSGLLHCPGLIFLSTFIYRNRESSKKEQEAQLWAGGCCSRCLFSFWKPGPPGHRPPALTAACLPCAQSPLGVDTPPSHPDWFGTWSVQTELRDTGRALG